MRTTDRVLERVREGSTSGLVAIAPRRLASPVDMRSGFCAPGSTPVRPPRLQRASEAGPPLAAPSVGYWPSDPCQLPKSAFRLGRCNFLRNDRTNRILGR